MFNIEYVYVCSITTLSLQLVVCVLFFSLEIPLKVTITLQEMFDRNKSMSEGIIDHLCTPSEGVTIAMVTASLYIPSLDKLVCGCEDGKIVITFALHAARARLLRDHPLLRGMYVLMHQKCFLAKFGGHVKFYVNLTNSVNF